MQGGIPARYDGAYISALDAKAIDTKTDDGDADRGTILGDTGRSAATCWTAGSNLSHVGITKDYKVSNTGVSCVQYFCIDSDIAEAR